jgi:hypothetical protein
MRSHLFLVLLILVSLCLGGCISSYSVHIIKVHEMIQDMEAIELDEPERASELPETGILVNNKTDTTIQVTMRGKKEQVVTVPPGGSGKMALTPGNYHYKIAAEEAIKGKNSKGIYIDLRGTKKIVGKILYIYDVFTKQEVVKEKELAELRSR